MQRKNTEIENLRAIAILMVLVAHSNYLFPWGPAPFYFAIGKFFNLESGVDLFFCISGFVVSKSFVGEMDRAKGLGNQQMWTIAKAFWVRRVFRLLPSAWLWVVLMLVASLAYNRTGIFGEFSKDFREAVSVATYTFNFFTYSVLHRDAGQVILGPYWSLTLEEQFYFLFPFFVIFVAARWRMAALLALIGIQFVINRQWNGVLFWVRLDAIMWGIVIYLFSRQQEYRIFEPEFCANSSARFSVNAILLLLMAAIWTAIPPDLPFATGLVALLCAGLVFLASFGKGYGVGSKWLDGLLGWFGARSYGIYLIHMPVLRFTQETMFRLAEHQGRALNGTFTFRIVLMNVVLIAVLAELNYRIVERPLRNFGRQVADRMIGKAHATTHEAAPV